VSRGEARRGESLASPNGFESARFEWSLCPSRHSYCVPTHPADMRVCLCLSTDPLVVAFPLSQLLSRGTWHDHKAARLRLLLGSLDSLDCVALQELYSSSVDARYRNMVLHEASLRGFHYAVPVARVPRLPAVLLNAGTLILSRYAISHSASIVFPTKAFYDLVRPRGWKGTAAGATQWRPLGSLCRSVPLDPECSLHTYGLLCPLFFPPL